MQCTIRSEGSNFFYKKLKIPDHFAYYYNGNSDNISADKQPGALKVIENIRMLLHLNPFPGCSMGGRIFYCNYK